MANNDAKLESIKSEIRSLLVSTQTDMSIQNVLNDYKECVGRPLPFLEFGFKSAVTFFKSLKDVVEVKETFNGTVLVPIKSKNSSHINNLVSKQRSTKSRGRQRRSRHYRANTIKQGNHTYYQTVRPRRNMHLDTLMDDDDFDSDELDHLDIVWTKDSPPSEDDDLINGGSKSNEYRKASPLPVIHSRRNDSPSRSSLNSSADGETDYEFGFKEPNSSGPIKETSLFKYDSTNCNRSFGENISKSNNNHISSTSSSLNNHLKESRPSNINTEKSLKVDNPTNFKRFFPAKCDDNSKSDSCPVLRHSSALRHDKVLNQERQDETFRRTSPTYYDFTETKSRNIKDKMDFNRRTGVRRSIPSDYDSDEIQSPSMETSISSSNSGKTVKSICDSVIRHATAHQSDSHKSLPSLSNEENILKPDLSDDILGKSSPIKYDTHETINSNSSGYTMKSYRHPALRKSVLFPNDLSENENSSDDDKFVKKFDCDRTLKRPTPVNYDHNETKTFLDCEEETEADLVYRRPSSSNSKLHSPTSCGTKYRSDVLRRPPATIHDDYNETISSLNCEEKTEADLVYRRLSSSNSKLHSPTSCGTKNRSDVHRRPPAPVDYDHNGTIPSLDSSQVTEAANSVSNNSKLHSSTSWDKSNKSDNPVSCKQFSLDCFVKKMKALHPTLSRSSLDEYDLISHNTSPDLHKSKTSSVQKQEDKNCEVNVSEEHYLYLWALVNGIIIDEAKVIEPHSRLINLTKKSGKKISKKDLETISSLVDGKMISNSFSDDTSERCIIRDHYQFNECENDDESYEHDVKVQHFESVTNNICLNCEFKVNKCVCSKPSEKLKNKHEIKDSTLTSSRESEMSRYDNPKYNNQRSFKHEFSGMSRGKLFKEKLMQSERLGLNDNNPLVNSNVGRGVAIKKLLETHRTNERPQSSPDIVIGRGYFLKQLQNKYLEK